MAVDSKAVAMFKAWSWNPRKFVEEAIQKVHSKGPQMKTVKKWDEFGLIEQIKKGIVPGEGEKEYRWERI